MNNPAKTPAERARNATSEFDPQPKARRVVVPVDPAVDPVEAPRSDRQPPELPPAAPPRGATDDPGVQRVARGKIRWARNLSRNSWIMIAVAVTVALAAVAVSLAL